MSTTINETGLFHKKLMQLQAFFSQGNTKIRFFVTMPITPLRPSSERPKTAQNISRSLYSAMAMADNFRCGSLKSIRAHVASRALISTIIASTAAMQSLYNTDFIPQVDQGIKSSDD